MFDWAANSGGTVRRLMPCLNPLVVLLLDFYRLDITHMPSKPTLQRVNRKHRALAGSHLREVRILGLCLTVEKVGQQTSTNKADFWASSRDCILFLCSPVSQNRYSWSTWYCFPPYRTLVDTKLSRGMLQWPCLGPLHRSQALRPLSTAWRTRSARKMQQPFSQQH